MPICSESRANITGKEKAMRKDSVTKRAIRMYYGNNPQYLPLNFLQVVFREVSPYFNLWMSSEIVTALYDGRERQELYLLVAIALLGNFVIRVIWAILGRSVTNAMEVLTDNEAAAFYRKTLSLDYNKLENPETRQLRFRIKENSWINGYGVYNMRMNVEKLMTCVVNLVFSGILFMEMLRLIIKVPFRLISFGLLAAMTGSLALTILFQSINNKKSSTIWDEVGTLLLQENQFARDYSLGGMDNRIYHQQVIRERLLDKFNKKHLKVYSGVLKRVYLLDAPVSVFTKLTQLCAYLIVCLYCTLGVFPVGSVIKYVGYLGKITENIGSLFFIANGFRINAPFLKTYLDYFDIKNDMYQGSLAVEKRSDKKFDIEFKNVSFQYAGSDTYALKNLNLNLKVGERLAVVGMNGSGKTTFIKLLCRLYDPTEGEILMNDFNIRKYDYRQYLDIFSVVFQDYNLLAVPLGNNVASAATWDSEKAERLLREVGFGERYEEMPKKLETPLYKNFDEDGVNISGGDAQKIALARALYKDAPFIILDEPTAALDPIAEAEIYSKFDGIVGDKTAIYISHRLSSCRFCDKIAVFDKGEIVQTGTHEELLSDEKGKYYELWHAQAQYYQ